MRVVHEGAGFGQIELIDKSLARRDARMAEPADAVHARGQDQPVPMHGGMLGQAVGDIDAHPVTLDRLNGGAGGLAVIPPEPCDHPVGQFALHRFCDEMEFFHTVVHPVRQGPAVERDYGVVIRPRGGAGWGLGQRTVHHRGFGQAHVHGLAPCFGGHERCTRSTGPQQLTSVHHLVASLSQCPAPPPAAICVSPPAPPPPLPPP